MKRGALLCLLSIMVLGIVGSGALTGSQTPSLGVRNTADELIGVMDESGNAYAVQRPDGKPLRLVPYVQSLLASVAGADWTGTGAYTGAPIDPAIRRVTHDDPDRGIRIGPDGHVELLDPASGEAALDQATGQPAPQLTSPPTIDRMTTSGGYYQTFQPGAAVGVLGSAVTYYLNNGSSWQSGAGTYRLFEPMVDHVEVSGQTIRYVLGPPPNGLLYDQTDFDSGDHSSQGSLGASGALVIETVAGATTAVLRGRAEILSNDPTYYGDRFNYFSAPVGAIVPFEVTYTLYNATWTQDTFSTSFYYSYSGVVDFAHPISVPKVTGLAIAGSTQVPAQSTAQFFATVLYENGVQKNVTDAATWAVEPAALASVDHGLLSTGTPDPSPAPLTLHATYTEGGIEVQADKVVLLVAGGSAALAESWEMYQADSSHSGWLPVILEPQSFAVRWQRTVAAGKPLNPVTEAGGRVFVSLLTYFGSGPAFFALDSRDGETLWSKDFGRVFSVNPPAYAYGNVYIQTGDHASDTWLYAFDAETGDRVFKVPHAAQWERYYAPTIFNGTVYVDGGYYGGMYAFDAFSGQQRWFVGLQQYDQWTPAVDDSYAYAYVGSYSPGLYVFNRLTGVPVFMIQDRNFEWNGWSMNLAPVLGASHDVLAIHNGRLISFDTQSRSIRFEIAGGFTGQPSVAHGAIYAIRYGGLAVLDEDTGAEVWSWQSLGGALTNTLIVTESHVIATTGTSTFAVDLLERDLVWSYPVGGNLALGDDMLYIASANGVLTAISMPGFSPATLVKLEIAGPSQVQENSTAQFSAMAYYDDGRVRNRTLVAQWSIDSAPSASLDTNGVLTTTELFTPVQPVTIHATYSENGVSVEAQKTINVIIGVTLDQFVIRNLAGARSMTQHVLEELSEASVREQAARAVLGRQAPATPSRIRALNDLVRAINWGRLGQQSLDRDQRELNDAMMEMNQGGTTSAPIRRPPNLP